MTFERLCIRESQRVAPFPSLNTDTLEHTSIVFLFNIPASNISGTAVTQRLRCCAINLKVAGSIPDVVIGIFHRHNPSHRTTALGSNQPLTEMSTGSIYWR